MKEMIKTKLSKIPDLEERKLLKDILTYTFQEMIDYCDNTYNQLEKEVFEQMAAGDSKRHVIYTTLMNREDYDPIDEFMYPIIETDLKEPEIEADEVLKELQEKGTAIVGRTFLKYGYLELKKLLKEDRSFQGEVITDENRYPVIIKLKQSKRYIQYVSELYQDFLANGIEWTSINSPYLYKYVDFEVEVVEGLQAGEVIRKVSVNLEEIEAVRKDHAIPCWNLERMMLQSTNFPIPTRDNMHFEHKINLATKGESYHYIVNFGEKNPYDGYCIRDDESVSIILKLDSMDEWPAYYIKEEKKDSFNTYPYPVYSNGETDDFMGRYTKHENKIIHTKAELMRKILSYEAVKMMQVEEVVFCEDSSEEVRETYSMNEFMEEDVRQSAKREMLVVRFLTKEIDFCTRDVMSFVTSELQRYFPEYDCTATVREV